MANIFFIIYTNKVPHIHNIFRCPRMLERFFEVDPWVDIPLVGPSDPIGTSSKSLDHKISRPLNLSRSDLIKTYVKPNRPVINPPNHEGGGGLKRPPTKPLCCLICSPMPRKKNLTLIKIIKLIIYHTVRADTFMVLINFQT